MTSTATRADEELFVMTYDGPAVAGGRMDAHSLGSSMLAMAQLIDASASLTMGAGVAIKTEIAADFRRGSFSFAVVTTVEAAQHANDLLSRFSLHDLLEIVGVTGGGGGLIGFIRWLRRRKIESVTPLAGRDLVTVTVEDGQTTQINAKTVVLFQNSTVNLHLNEVVEPLRGDGINELRTGKVGETPMVVRSEDASSFEPRPVEGETLQDKVSTEIIRVAGIRFAAGRKWTFSLADGTTFNSALDPEFMKAVLHHDFVFGAGDALEAEVHTVVTRDSAGELRAFREIKRVLRHLPAPSQLRLPFVDDRTVDPNSIRRADLPRLPSGE